MRQKIVRQFLLGICLLFFSMQSRAEDRNPFPEVAEAYLIEVNGKILWEKNPNKKLPLASLTKLLTAIVAIENSDLREEVVVSERATRETGTKLGLVVGDKVYREDLLKAALIGSANDACYALAESVNASPVGFVQIMNNRALELGMKDSHFTNPCGHDHKDHYSTVSNLRLLAKKAESFSEIKRVVSTTETAITTTNSKRSFALKTQNALIGRSKGVYGLKTGYTPKAGKCLIASATRNTTELLLIFLNAADRWWDAYDIIDIAFQHENG